jgi:hypothetical protein
MDKYNRLTVLSKEPSIKDKWGTRTVVKCECECGNIKNYRLSDLKSGKTKSCGCLHKQIITVHNDGTNTRKHYYIYQLWKAIIKRCYNKNNHAYKHYGQRGITMYKLWINDYNSFKQWIITNLGERPINYSIDRIDVNGNYEPGNLRWADKKTQTHNRRPFNNK